MNAPKISLKIIRHNHVRNILGESYDDVYNPFQEVVNVGTYTLAHTEGMQEFLKQEDDVTSNIEYLEEDILNFISRR